jgi:adenine-specific DNA-methyltransferase
MSKTNQDLEKELIKEYITFPSTRYQGSKRRLLPWLYEIFKQVEFDTVLDAFGGSGSASYLFKSMGKTVYYNDILKSNYQTGVALIENDNAVLDEADIDFLLRKPYQEYSTFIADTFRDVYYYSEENNWLDMIVFNIKMLSSAYRGELLRKKRALAFHSLFQACLSKRPFNLFHRKNLYLRDANVIRTFGNKKTWDVDFSVAFRKFALETSSKVFSNKKANKAYCNDVMHLRKNNYDLVYLDPPYQRPTEIHPKDYFSMYHFLEGLVDYDNWASRVDVSKKHKPLHTKLTKLDNLSPLERIDKILEKFHCSTIAISYGTPGVPTVAELKSLLKKYKKNVEVFDTEFSYKLNKKNGSKLREILVLGY